MFSRKPIIRFSPFKNKHNGKMILVSHLVSESGDAFKPFTYISDGEYEGFKWKDGKWVHEQNVFNVFGKRVSLEELIRDDDGGKSLEDSSIRALSLMK